MTSHLVKFTVKGFVKVPQFLDHLWVNIRMSPAFGFAQTVWFAVGLGPLKAREAFCGVEVKMPLRHYPAQPEKVLNSSHLPSRVAYQSLSTHKQQLLHRKEL